eukprot:scaffold34756_cov28-Tisochrysis_lutea.AAC.2
MSTEPPPCAFTQQSTPVNVCTGRCDAGCTCAAVARPPIASRHVLVGAVCGPAACRTAARALDPPRHRRRSEVAPQVRRQRLASRATAWTRARWQATNLPRRTLVSDARGRAPPLW